MIPHRHSESGYTLIEFCIVLLIAGVMISAALIMTKPYIEMAKRNATIAKQKQLAVLLSEYSLNIGRMPCPASPNPTVEPYGSPRNSTATGLEYLRPCHTLPDGTTWANAIGANYIGI